MARFYLNEYPNPDGGKAWRIPAAGLIYYLQSPADPNTFDEFIIDAQGQPVRRNATSIPFPAGVSQHAITPDAHEIGRNDWFEAATDPSQPAYLAFRPFDVNNPPLMLWKNALVPLAPAGGEPAFKFPRRILHTMIPALAKDRLRAGYVNAKERLNLLPVPMGSFANAEPFLVALNNVSSSLIDTIQLSLNEANPPNGQNSLVFNFPEWVFLLNRTVAEGFIEGHAQFQLTDSQGFDIHATGKQTWKKIIERVQEGWNMDQLRQSQDSPEKTEEINSIDDLGRYMRQILQAPAWFDSFFNHLVLHTLSPGSVPEQVFAWWYMHFPHWHRDMAFALDRYFSPMMMHYTGMSDWNTIAKIIMQSFPKEGAGLDVADRLQAWAMQVIGRADAFPDVAPRLIELVFENIELRVQQAQNP